PSEWLAAVAALAGGSKTDIAQSQRFASLAKLTGVRRRDAYLQIFCTTELSARKIIVTQQIQTAHPGLFEKLRREQQRVCALPGGRRAIAARDRTAALITIASEVIARYQAEKDRRGWLDYEDLIDKALALLTNVRASWVHYKLDRGI